MVEGRDLPGRAFEEHTNVHVALQVRRDPEGAVPGDGPRGRWEIDVRVVDGDIRGPAVHGRPGERFLYLTWGDVDADGGWQMFRRAKLMLGQIEPDLVRRAVDEGRSLVVVVSLTDERGGPRCARVTPPALRWTLGQASGARSL